MQLTAGLVSAGLDPQTAIGMPCSCNVDGTRNGVVSIEEGVHDDVIDEVEAMGHGNGVDIL